MAESKRDIAALRQEISAQRERLIEEKIEKGEAVRVSPIIVGAGYAGDIEREQARRTAELRAAGETGEIIFGPRK